MTRESITIVFLVSGTEHMVIVPLDISVNELAIGLNEAYHVFHDRFDVTTCYLRAENPIALLHGSKTLRDYHLYNGTRISFLTEA